VEPDVFDAPKTDFYIRLRTTHDYAIDIVGVIYEPTGETLTDA
jgi:hypothetical protein